MKNLKTKQYSDFLIVVDRDMNECLIVHGSWNNYETDIDLQGFLSAFITPTKQPHPHSSSDFLHVTGQSHGGHHTVQTFPQ